MAKLPKWLERTEAQIAAEAETQAQRRAGFTRAKLTEAERLISRGALLEQTARNSLAVAHKHKNKERLAIEKGHLAEALAMQGRYDEAAKLHPDKTRTAYFRSIVKAIHLDDAKKCQCKDTEAEIDGVTIALTPRFAARRIYSLQHKKVVSLITCSKCGHMNAREPKGRLSLQTPQGVRPLRDSQLLQRADTGKTSG
jgi:hypothetical protein